MQFAIARIQAGLQFGLAPLDLLFEGLPLSGFPGQLFTQRSFGVPSLEAHGVGGLAMLGYSRAQGLQFVFVFGAALLQTALLAFAVVQARAQGIALGVQLTGALHQKPDAGG